MRVMDMVQRGVIMCAMFGAGDDGALDAGPGDMVAGRALCL